MNLTRKQVIDIYGTLNTVGQKDMPVKGAYAVSKNKKIAENEVKVIEEAQNSMQEPEGIKEFTDKRIEICKEFANKDENGEAIVKQNRFDIPLEKQPKFEEAVALLKEDYKEAFDKQDELTKEFQELLDEEIEMDFHMMKLEWLPEKISGRHMEALMDLIDEG